MVDIPKNGKHVTNGDCLDFENKVAGLDRQINELRELSSKKGIDYSPEIRRIEHEKV